MLCGIALLDVFVVSLRIKCTPKVAHFPPNSMYLKTKEEIRSKKTLCGEKPIGGLSSLSVSVSFLNWCPNFDFQYNESECLVVRGWLCGVQQSLWVSCSGWVPESHSSGFCLWSDVHSFCELLCKRKITFAKGFLQHWLGCQALLGKFTPCREHKGTSLQSYRFGCSLSNQKTTRQCQLL